MEALISYQNNLPETIEDLAKFVLFAPEKATALRAEIRAIKKLNMAQEIYDQKMEEQRQLASLILDADIRLGELTKAIPKAPQDRGNQYTGGKTTALSGSQKTKTEVIQSLGFTPKQVERFETLANNKDLVEQEKTDAEREGRAPTVSNVLEMAAERKKKLDAEYIQIDVDFDNLKIFRKAIAHPDFYTLNEEILDSVARVDDGFAYTLSDLAQYIEQLIIVKNKLIVKGANYAKAKRSQ